jgi:tetratricopeptide (TPR) repeat protein
MASDGDRLSEIELWRASFAPAMAEVLRSLATNEALIRNPETHVALYRALCALTPEDWKAHRGLADWLVQCKRLPEALEAVRRALDLRPSEAYLHDLHGRVQFEVGDVAGALESGKRAVQLAPREISSYELCARAMLRAGSSAEALEVAERGLENGSHPVLHFLRGEALLRVDRVDDALDALDTSLAHVVSFEALCLRAKGRLVKGFANGALQDIDKAATLGRVGTDVMMTRAKALMQIDQRADAKTMVEHVLALQPDDADAKSLLQEIESVE